MPRPFPIKIELDGRTYRGDWQLMHGGRICVRSLGCGSMVAEVGRARPEAVAPLVLARIVRAYYKDREAEQKRREREVARVNRYWDRQRLGDGP